MTRYEKAMELYPALLDEDRVEEVFKFLDHLRDSGETNMFGARPYIMDAFGFGKVQALAYLNAWMKTFE